MYYPPLDLGTLHSQGVYIQFPQPLTLVLQAHSIVHSATKN